MYRGLIVPNPLLEPRSETKKKLKNARSSSSDKNRKASLACGLQTRKLRPLQERREKRRRSERSRLRSEFRRSLGATPRSLSLRPSAAGIYTLAQCAGPKMTSPLAGCFWKNFSVAAGAGSRVA